MDLQDQLYHINEKLNKLERTVIALQSKLDKLYKSALPWDEAPAWARWAAMDRDQCWWWYEDEPTMRMSTWGVRITGQKCESFVAPPCDVWQESKQARP